MRIVWIRRISQAFFLCLFLWLVLAGTLGEEFWQLRGWPVNWFLELDPLTGLGTLLTTGAVYRGLLWGLLVLVLTIVLGRFWCSWVCPFGTMHHALGWLGRRGRSLKDQAALNRPRPAQSLKFYLLLFFLVAALLTGLAGGSPLAGGLLSGLLDPIPLAQRSLSLFALPLADRPLNLAWPSPRFYDGVWLVAAVFIAALLANLWLPRFYCRFVCPLGALLGLVGKAALWRIGKTQAACSGCLACEAACEGACRPAGRLRQSECVLCLNCLDGCGDGVITFGRDRTAPGEAPAPDFTRRGLAASLATGALAGPALGLGGLAGPGWNPSLVRPPGALDEARFLSRCLRCGQCMRVCPTGVIQPAGLEYGLEALWTPVLNMRLGTSGCQLNCTACGFVCPSAAIRPLSLEEKLGLGEYAGQGPVRLGTAFVDRGRCLPWAMDRPCIVCQENCPVSPKAIFTREEFSRLPLKLTAKSVEGGEVRVAGPLEPGRLSGGDYYLVAGEERRRILGASAGTLIIAPGGGPVAPGRELAVDVRLQRPYVDPARCIGCGVCSHECPVAGKRAIRVTAENETRNPGHRLLAGKAGR